jgi:hypothetical protein
MDLDKPAPPAANPDAERAAIAERASEIRQHILRHPDENRPATAGEVAAALALIERLARVR